MIVIFPEVAAKLLELNDATPFTEVEASLPEICTALSVIAISIPVPAKNDNVSPVLNVSVVVPLEIVKFETTVSKLKLPEPSTFKNCPI